MKKVFIQGMLFASIGFTLIEAILSIIEQFTEYVNTQIAIKTYQLKQSLQIKPEEDNDDFQFGFCSTEAIGVPMEQKYEIEEEEDY